MLLCIIQVRLSVLSAPFTGSLTLHSANKRYVCQLKSMWLSRVVNLATWMFLFACGIKLSTSARLVGFLGLHLQDIQLSA